MFIAPGEKLQVARLFDFFLQGEQLAFDCASRQAEIFPDIASRRFFQTQARQEKFHVRIFRCGIGILAPKGLGRSSTNLAMEAYRRQLESALEHGDFAQSLLGMQIILEGLGDVALNHISSGCRTRGVGFERVRRLVLGQEDAHHAYGMQRFAQFLDSEPSAVEYYQPHFQDYYSLLIDVVASVSGLFEHFDEDPREYLSEFESSLPEYFRSPSSGLKCA